MRERPILFSAPMVLAILDGTKNQTRRVVKERVSDQDHGRPHNPMVLRNGVWLKPNEWSPYGQLGDRLWVRETFCLEGSQDYGINESRVPKDGRPYKGEDDDGNWAVPWYRATDGEPNIVPDDLPDSSDDRTRWKPSIFMPRWASRITLEVTEVRVQRLNEISEEDAKAEGVNIQPPVRDKNKIAFQRLWDSINVKRQGCAWADNPWVWAITFKRLKP